MSRRWRWFLAWLLIPLGTCWAGGGDPPAWHGLRPAESIGGPLALVDQRGRPFRLERLERPLALLAFGYTRCPDICPDTLGVMQQVVSRLPEALRPARLFVTLDPRHDIPAVLRDYLAWFDEDIVGLSGTPEAVAEVSGRYRVNAVREAEGHIAHSAYLYLIDARGRVLLLYPHGTAAEAIRADIIALYTRAARR